MPTFHEKIIDAATELFLTQGFRETTIENIANQCGVCVSELHSIYTTKDNIAVDVLKNAQSYFDSNVFIYAYDNMVPPYKRLVRINRSIEECFCLSSVGRIFILFAIEVRFTSPIVNYHVQRYFSSCFDAYLHVFNAVHPLDQAKLLAEEFVSDLQGALVMTRAIGANSPLRRLSARCLQAMQYRRNVDNP